MKIDQKIRNLFAWLSYLLLCSFFSVFAWADNLNSNCSNTTVNNTGDDGCYTVTLVTADVSAITIDATEPPGEWSTAFTKNLNTESGHSGTVRFLRSIDAYYIRVEIIGGSYQPQDRISVYFDVLHNHGIDTDDIEFRIVRDINSPNHQKITNAGAAAWNPGAANSELSIIRPDGRWIAVMKIHKDDLGLSDLPSIIGFGVQAQDPADSGAEIEWPHTFLPFNPADTWANIKSRYPIEYMIVMDWSGSMLSPTQSGGVDRKWDNAMTATNYLSNILAILRDAIYFDDQLGITTFGWNCSGGDITMARPLQSISSFPWTGFTEGINAPELNSCTPIARGLEDGFSILGYNAQETQRVVLLLTDGMHNRPSGDNFDTEPDGISYKACNSSAWDICSDSLIQVNSIAFGEGDGYVDTELVNKIRHHYSGELGTSYNLATTKTGLKEAFISSLDEIYQVDIALSEVPPASFPVDSSNQRMIAIVSWNNEASAVPIKFQIDEGGWTDAICNPASQADTHFGFAACAVDNPEAGTWRVVDAGDNLVGDYLFVLMDLNLRARFKVEQQVHGTGMGIMLTADLNQGGVPLTDDAAHPVSVIVDIEKPQAGLGNLLSTVDPLTCQRAEPQLPKINIDGRNFSILTHSRVAGVSLKPQSSDPAAAHFQLAASILSACTQYPLNRKVIANVELHDNGRNGDITANDGIYSRQFNNTQYEGSYVFRFKASGKSLIGDDFLRTKSTAEFVRVKVAAAETKASNRILSRNGSFITREYSIIPRDIFKSYLGPGHLGDIRFKVSGGTQMGTIQDYNNGIYAVLVRYDSNINEPTVVPIVQGTVIIDKDTQDPLGKYYSILLLIFLLLFLMFWPKQSQT
ncbi:MAG: hypothetical protein GQ583_02360 [Methyloprofundus sp.]|nr:hypothetical protein [Methyloprofundus sp.]